MPIPCTGECEPGNPSLWDEFWLQYVVGGEPAFARWLEARKRLMEKLLPGRG